MKKLLFVFMLFILSFSLVACGSDSKSADAKKDDVKQEDVQKKTEIIGSTKEEVISMLDEYTIDSKYTENVDKNALKFQDENLLIVVDFNSSGIAEGVYFLSNNKDMDFVTGEGSYVSKNYDELLKLATSNKNLKIVNDVFEYTVEFGVGDLHD